MSVQDADKVLQWLDSEGIDTQCVAPSKSGSRGTGLVAKRNLQRGTVVLSVPQRLWLTPSVFDSSPLASHADVVTKPWLKLALYLMLARSGHAGSEYAPYIDALPECTDSPLFWSPEDAELLAGSQLQAGLQSYTAFLEREYSNLCENVFPRDKDLFDGNIFSFDSFVWAFGILRSRALPPCDSGADVAIIPGLDLANYNPSAAGSPMERAKEGFFRRKQQMRLRAHADIAEGDEVFVDYATTSKGDQESALDFGFVESSESKPSYKLTIYVSADDKFKDDKDDCLNVCGLGEVPVFSLQPTDPVPDGLLPALRIRQLNGTDAFLLEATFRDNILSIVENPISEENEAAVCDYMLDMCKHILDGYVTSQADDRSVVQSSESTLQQKTAALITLGEKQSLIATMDAFEGQRSRLHSLEYYQERRLRQLGLLDEEGERVSLDPFREIVG